MTRRYLICCANWRQVKVRINKTPREPEIDGVRLDGFRPGTVRDVSAILGAWLVAERYAEPEMRRSVDDNLDNPADVKGRTTQALDSDRPRRRRHSKNG